MFVKTYKKDNVWYRSDNDSILGTEIGGFDGKIFVESSVSYSILLYGCILNDKFVKYCTCTKCPCNLSGKDNCRYNRETTSTSGYYLIY